MKITFDPSKNDINIRKHGVDLAQAELLDWDSALVWVDSRFEYDEIRMIAIAPLTNQLFYVVFVDREDMRRVISMRRTTNREKEWYVSHY